MAAAVPSELGRLVKDLRVERGWSQTRASVACRLGQALFGRLESGRARYVRSSELEALAEGFGIPVGRLWAQMPTWSPKEGFPEDRYHPVLPPGKSGGEGVE